MRSASGCALHSFRPAATSNSTSPEPISPVSPADAVERARIIENMRRLAPVRRQRFANNLAVLRQIARSGR
jgi:hypothetical protein